MTDKTLQKHDKTINTMEGKWELFHATVEQLGQKVSESQTQTNLRMGELVIKVSQFTAAVEDFKVGMEGIMRFLNKEKVSDLDKEGSTLKEGKSPQTPTNFATHNSAPLEDIGSVHPHNLNTNPDSHTMNPHNTKANTAQPGWGYAASPQQTIILQWVLLLNPKTLYMGPKFWPNPLLANIIPTTVLS